MWNQVELSLSRSLSLSLLYNLLYNHLSNLLLNRSYRSPPLNFPEFLGHP
jgi:hypothetical protein